MTKKELTRLRERINAVWDLMAFDATARLAMEHDKGSASVVLTAAEVAAIALALQEVEKAA